MKIWDKIKNHYKDKSKFAIATDILFYALIIAMLFPSSRAFVMEHVQRVTMLSPREKKEVIQLSPQDYDWYVYDVNNQIHKLSDYKGKVIFINFWATWCGPCLAEMPALKELYDRYKDNPDIMFLFVTTEDLTQSEQFLKKRGWDVPVYKQVTRQPEVLYSSSIPSTYLIDKEGKIIVEAHRATRWNSAKSLRLINRLIAQ